MKGKSLAYTIVPESQVTLSKFSATYLPFFSATSICMHCKFFSSYCYDECDIFWYWFNMLLSIILCHDFHIFNVQNFM